MIVILFYRSKKCTYDKGNLVAAVQEVKNSKMSISEAARKFNVPRTTLSDHINGRVKDFRPPGHERELPEEVEAAIVEYIAYTSRQNFPLRRNDVRTIIIVSEYTGPYFGIHAI